ncbi:MAG: AMP-binding protein, partial [Methylococcales bacterium]|nr:AMP-binding protein [Methylococcales bacterium]
SAGMISACKTAKIKTVLTSRRFIELAKFDDDANALAKQVNLIYLEDLAQSISIFDKLKALVQGRTASLWYKHHQFNPDSPAVILFTSGSEGEPKGVVLSHSNILANHNQLKARINFNAQDVVLNFLPMFHSFGFTVGTMLPVLNGMKTFFYPSPLHYSVIPEIAYDIGATIMFGTNTFLAAYAKKAHAYDFYTLRYIVAGAEKLHDSTRDLWAEKFGLRVLEGYGATETAPVASVNTPMDFKAGTVGRLMPNMQYKLEQIPGIEDAGQLHVYGPNIMQGYLLSDNPGKLIPPKSVYGKGWYDTGDIVNIDEDGFVSIRGRTKRFAKVSGEMVSLAAIEAHAVKAWPNAQHASTSMPDSKKGEQVILLTTQKGADSKQLAKSAKGVHAISLPKRIFVVKDIPVLATGKTNYPEVSKLADKKLQDSSKIQSDQIAAQED